MEINEPQRLEIPGSCIYQLKMGSYKMVISIGALLVDTGGYQTGAQKTWRKMAFVRGGASMQLRRPDFLRQSSLGGVPDPQFV